MAISYNYNFAQLARDSGFKLRQYKDGPLDWRLIGCLEVERILREQSLEQIDGVLNHLSEAPLGNILDTNILDSGIAKYFTLSQFSIQYLLFCRQFLDETVRELRESLVESQLEVGKLKKSLTESNNEILQLNKKITQIEAIHEVVFPCHMCTKNFVSNEALNIHIGRKHGGGRMPEKRNETPLSSSTQREKDNDRNLINTIKLELEIKQLKERLNVAEKSIRERSGPNSRRPSPRTSGRKLITRDVAIQSNLMEEKEKDDATGSEEEGSRSPLTLERKEQLMKLHEKIIDFEQWRETQMINNEENIAEINQKLADIAQVLEASKQQKHSDQAHELPQPLNTNMQRTMSPSVDQLEKLLTEKVAEIGKASAEKLEEVVFHMEKNYKVKLDELEREIKQRNEAAARSKVITQQERATNMNDDNLAVISTQEAATKVTPPKMPAPQIVASKVIVPKMPVPKMRQHDETYEIENFPEVQTSKSNRQGAAKQILPVAAAKHLKESLSSESNRTFVKMETSTNSIKETPKIPHLVMNVEDSTDISDTLSEEESETGEEEEEQNSTTDASEEQTRPKSSKRATLPKTESKAKVDKLLDLEALNGEIYKRQQTAPIKFTRKDAKKLSSRRIGALGCDAKSTSITRASFNKFNIELTERRNKLKQKYPNFSAARSRIRKLVDKLCSAKLPENAQAMLRKTQPQRPPDGAIKKLRHYDPELEENFETELESELEPNTSTPLKDVLNVKSDDSSTGLRHRLERVLGSPIRKPVDVQIAPVPVPRKRVMFNTLSSGTDSIESGKHKDQSRELAGI